MGRDKSRGLRKAKGHRGEPGLQRYPGWSCRWVERKAKGHPLANPSRLCPTSLLIVSSSKVGQTHHALLLSLLIINSRESSNPSHLWLRADRRPGEKLRVYFLGDYPLPMPVKLTRAKDITPEAASKTEQLVMAVKKVKAEIEAAGKEASQRAIARIVGCSQVHVLRILRLIHSANNDSNSKMYQGTISAQEGSDAHMLGTEYLPRLAFEDPVDQVEGLLNAFVAHGGRVIKQAWSFLSAAASIQLQSGLLLAANVQKQMNCGNRFCTLAKIKILCKSLNYSALVCKELQSFVSLFKRQTLPLVFSSKTLSPYYFQSLYCLSL